MKHIQTAVDVYLKSSALVPKSLALRDAILFARQRCVGLVLGEYAQARQNGATELAEVLDQLAQDIESINIEKGA